MLVIITLVDYLGPCDVVEAGEIFGKIKMKRDAVPFSERTHRTKWQMAGKWCSLPMPKDKFLIKKFITGVYPPKFSKNFVKFLNRQVGIDIS